MESLLGETGPAVPLEVEEAEAIPDWWIKPECDLRDQVTHFGVEMDGGPREPEMTFSKPKSLASLTLLDAGDTRSRRLRMTGTNC